MVSLTLSIPDDLKKKMDQHKIINWSEVARQAITEKVEFMEKFQQFTKNSTLTEDDAIKLGREVSEKAGKRLKKWKRGS